MKSIKIMLLSLAALGLSACNDFLDVPPTGVVDQELAMDEPEKMVNAAYSSLGDCWYDCPNNLWPYGDLGSDDCLKGGGGLTDTNYNPMEIWSTLTSTPGELDALWYRLYCHISRCNRALVSLQENGAAKLGKEVADRRIAEVHFLRGHFYFKLLILFRQIPWIDEHVYLENLQEKTTNIEFTYEELFDKVIDEFEMAFNGLPEVMPDGGGRANKVAAAAYLAKCYLTLAWGDGYEKTNGVGFIKPELMEKVITYTNVVVSSQYGYLEDFGDIFLPEYKNSKESVFAVQTSSYTEDNTRFGRANWSNTLNGCWHMWSCGWDFHKPSQDLVNAFKTKDGLPMFDDFDKVDSYPVAGGDNTQKYDPRLFHTVGMPTFPYKYEQEYIMTTDNSRTPDTYGYFTSLKEVPQRSQGEVFEGSWQAFAMNDYVFRYTDVMLMRAEALVELGRLEEARTIINDIRTRAANSVQKHIGYASEFCEITTYPTSYFTTKESARRCLQWERRLEMAMESSRYFDLRRWGIASTTLNAYFAKAKNSSYSFIDQNGKPVTTKYGQFYNDAHYTPDKNEFYPVPYNQLYYINGLYKQNRNY